MWVIPLLLREDYTKCPTPHNKQHVPPIRSSPVGNLTVSSITGPGAHTSQSRVLFLMNSFSGGAALLIFQNPFLVLCLHIKWTLC